jgi:hypothetical protein
VHLLAELRPAPAGPSPSDSLVDWVLLSVLLAFVVAAGYVLISRR